MLFGYTVGSYDTLWLALMKKHLIRLRPSATFSPRRRWEWFSLRGERVAAMCRRVRGLSTLRFLRSCSLASRLQGVFSRAVPVRESPGTGSRDTLLVSWAFPPAAILIR